MGLANQNEFAGREFEFRLGSQHPDRGRSQAPYFGADSVEHFVRALAHKGITLDLMVKPASGAWR